MRSTAPLECSLASADCSGFVACSKETWRLGLNPCKSMHAYHTCNSTLIIVTHTHMCVCVYSQANLYIPISLSRLIVYYVNCFAVLGAQQSLLGGVTELNVRIRVSWNWLLPGFQEWKEHLVVLLSPNKNTKSDGATEAAPPSAIYRDPCHHKVLTNPCLQCQPQIQVLAALYPLTQVHHSKAFLQSLRLGDLSCFMQPLAKVEVQLAAPPRRFRSQ